MCPQHPSSGPDSDAATGGQSAGGEGPATAPPATAGGDDKKSERLPRSADAASAKIGPMPQTRTAAAGKGPYTAPLGSVDAVSTADERVPPSGAPFGTAARRQPSATPLPPMPARRAKSSLVSRIWFFAAFVLPATFGTLYYGLFAADQYVSEFRFSVRAGQSSGSAAAAVGSSLLSSVLGGGGGAMDFLDNFTVSDYVNSDQAVRDVDKKLDLRKIFSDSRGDWWARLDAKATNERLARCWRHMVYSTYDPATGIAIVQVRAFSPEDAYAIASALQGLSEQLVNDITNRARQDMVRFAQQEVDRMEARSQDIRDKLTTLRNKEQVIDPNNSLVASNIAQDAALRTTITQIDTNISALMAQLGNRQAPGVRVLQAQREAAQRQLEEVDARINHSAGGKDPNLSQLVTQFEALNMELQTNEQVLAGTILNVQTVQATADAQQLYLMAYVRPALAQTGTYPKRLTSILVVFACGLLLWSVGMLLGNAISDHAS